MGPKEFFVAVWKIMFPKKVKVVERPGVIGHYNSKPFHNFHYALIYANETMVFDNDKVEVFAKIYKNTTFVNVLVNDETDFNILDYKFDKIKPLLDGKTYLSPKKEELKFSDTKNNIVVVLFQHYNEYTVNQAIKFCSSSKSNIEQALVYNAKEVQMDFYRPVPKFYRIYDILCEDLYFDLAFIDDTRD
jgi:hypothetical protein